MDKNKQKQLKRVRRHTKVRVKIKGTAKRPRLSVFRSNTSISLQLIDDLKGVTIASAHSREIKDKGKKQEVSFKVGELLAKKAIEANVTEVVFDRGGFNYHGRVKEAAEGARKGGLKF